MLEPMRMSYWVWLGVLLFLSASCASPHRTTARVPKDTEIRLLKPYHISTITLFTSQPENDPRKQTGAKSVKVKMATVKICQRKEPRLYWNDGRVVAIQHPENGMIDINFEDYFYIQDQSDIINFAVYFDSGNLRWSHSLDQIPDTGKGLHDALRQFEARFDGNELLRALTRQTETNSIDLSEATPLRFWSLGAQGATTGKLISAALKGDELRLDIKGNCLEENQPDATGVFWVNLKTRKVIKAVVNGRTMDLNSPFNYREKPR